MEQVYPLLSNSCYNILAQDDQGNLRIIQKKPNVPFRNFAGGGRFCGMSEKEWTDFQKIAQQVNLKGVDGADIVSFNGNSEEVAETPEKPVTKESTKQMKDTLIYGGLAIAGLVIGIPLFGSLGGSLALGIALGASLKGVYHAAKFNIAKLTEVNAEKQMQTI